MNIKIEVTQEEHAALIELLSDMSDLRYNQVTVLAHIPEGEDRYQRWLQQARDATKLLMKLSRY